ncbi:MAG: TetR/AcrR family transcriptional regulator [Bacteroidota bacterium]
MAFKLFAEHGYKRIELEDIAQALKVELSTITSLFPDKKALILETGIWKMDAIGEGVDGVMEMKIPVLQKMIKYLEFVYESVPQSIKITVGRFIWHDDFLSAIHSYLKRAVYFRFDRMLQEAGMENVLKEGADSSEALYSYWDMLSSILIANDSNQDPSEINSEKNLSEIICIGIIRVYHEILDSEASEKLDLLLKNHPQLSNFSA